MRAKAKQSGITLTEMTVVIAIMALLASFTIPAIRALFNSFESGGGTKAMISAAMATARAIAAKEGRYAGIRFQKAYDPENSDPLDGPQYMIFIIHEEPRKMGNLTQSGFRAVQGVKPIKLPDSVGVMDLNLGVAGDVRISEDGDFLEALGWRVAVWDTTTFSIVFSQTGKLETRNVRARNRDGVYQPADPSRSNDDVFNSKENIEDYDTGMFMQDDYAGYGLAEEPSRNSFIIYDREKFKEAYKKGRAYSDYLAQLVPDQICYINAYTGTIISRD